MKKKGGKTSKRMSKNKIMVEPLSANKFKVDKGTKNAFKNANMNKGLMAILEMAEVTKMGHNEDSEE